ncbi:GntR family transcriptional regulator [Robertmurraya massiliosenegalensis]|uniref:GntR family transcriptional regulator n=1 Tax=Robertmurraya TaxID=2837507 RepID=UPI0039A68B28
MEESLTLKEKAYIELKKQIVDGFYKPGEFLTERELVEDLKMSRTPIRAALERLVLEGFINHSPNQGLVVSELSLNKAVDIYDLRIALESHIVKKLSIRDWTDEEKNWFMNNLQGQEKCLEMRDYSEFTTLDAEFHKQLVVLYENSEILKIMENIQDQLQLIAIKVLRKESTRMVQSYKDHLEIYQHIIAGKPEAAELMATHLEFGKRILIS